MNEFTHLLDLASTRVGGAVLAASDEFFAPKENLLKPDAPVAAPDRYTDRGKWMDGWETRRRRTAGHDWCIIKLGFAGVVHSIDVDTAFFAGNVPSHCSIEGCGLGPNDDAAQQSIAWHPLVERRELSGNAHNTFDVRDPRRYTHLRLNIFPDGGIARLRVIGEVLPDWTRILTVAGDIDLASTVNGGYIVDASDRFFGDPRSMLMPGRAADVSEGWQTKRRRDPGHDWVIVRLGIASTVHRIEIDTAHFTGNYPESAGVEAAVVEEESGGVSADVSTRAIAYWKTVLPQIALQADHLHTFEREVVALAATHVRLNIHPDGGVSRFRVYAAPLAEARRRAILRLVNRMDLPDLRAALAAFSDDAAWIDRVAAERPLTSADALTSSAGASRGLAALLA